MNRLYYFILLVLSVSAIQVNAQPLHQKKLFTRQDSLRGSLNEERTGWDVLQYTISVSPDYTNRSITGNTRIRFLVVQPFKRMQLDLQEPMEIVSIAWGKYKLDFSREGNAYHVSFPRALSRGKTEEITIAFAGKPRVAVNPPWDGGWIFSKDKLGRPWMSVACQGLGASVWYPCKDHQSDEPNEGAQLNITVPDSLVAVGNGRMLTVKKSAGLATYSWAVKNPINNYNIIPYIGKYVNWTEEYPGEKGKLDCSYWVLDYELEKAKQQFKQVPLMLKSFEYWFGPYPFYEDGYKLIQAPHLGMEHQSAVAYGNGFQNGYRGRDLSGTGWGKKWDFIIVHESGHEWFANNITTRDIADMWVHEGFTNYSETLFTTSEYGVEAGNDYVIGTRKLIANDKPVIGPYGVNQEGSGDMYYKGGNLLHTIRQVIGNDDKFRSILRGLNSHFYHQTVSTDQIETYISKEAGFDFSGVFNQYLRDTRIPVLEYRIVPGASDTNVYDLEYRYTNTVEGFQLPVRIRLKNKTVTITPATSFQRLVTDIPETEKDAVIQVDRNYYINSKKLSD